jgi:hypothetical protein
VFGIPEVLWVAAAAVMGEAGFEVLKKRLWGLLKRHALPERVSPARYRFGLVLFVLPLLIGWLGPYATIVFPELGPHPIALYLAGDAIFMLSFFVLGGEFWDKLGALFSPTPR